ncbi:hypothetical protein CRUP_016714 [Coryphaenoides rupestris]|nr:hypothetical protein CRUP_016714 [Coryphaenoides rupestris]
MVTARRKQLYLAGAPRFNHTGKVIVFTMKNTGDLTILHTLLGQQIGSYFGSELASVDLDGDGDTDVVLVAAPMYYSQGWERGRVYMYSLSPQNQLLLQGVLEVTERAQNSRLGSALAPIPDMNGDGYGELVVGAPLEDDHRGAIYIFHGDSSGIQRKYKQVLKASMCIFILYIYIYTGYIYCVPVCVCVCVQRIPSVSVTPGLQYFGRSLHGVLDLNADGLVDLAVGALGGVVTIWSRSVLRISPSVTFEPEKVNVFNQDCQRGDREVSCMSLSVCLLAQTASPPPPPPPPPPPWETADYGRPIVVVMETGLQTPDEGPVLDPDWPSVLRTEVRPLL